MRVRETRAGTRLPAFPVPRTSEQVGKSCGSASIWGAETQVGVGLSLSAAV